MDAWINEPEPDSEDEVSQVGKGSLEIFYKSSGADAEFESYHGENSAYQAPEELQQVPYKCLVSSSYQRILNQLYLLYIYFAIENLVNF